jgi:hypothetical protein
MKNTVSLILLMAFLVSSCQIFEKKEILETEILVVGGGVSGVASALQAARMGNKVILVEESEWLGGMLTAAGVSATDGNHRMPSGIWGEFKQALIQHYGSQEALETGWVSNNQFEPHIGKQILEAWVDAESGITVKKGYWITDIVKIAHTLDRVVFTNEKGEILEIKAKQFIEATEYGDLLAKAGEPYTFGLESKSETGESVAPEKAYPFIQDLTYVAILNDLGNGKDNLLSKTDTYNPADFDCICLEACDDPNGKNLLTCEKVLEYGKLPNNKYMINWPNNGNDYFINILEMTREERLKSLEDAKKHTLNWIYFMQQEAGMKHLALHDEFGTNDKLALIPYIRESRRIKGEIIVNLNDIAEPYANPDRPLYKAAIAVGDYPVDHHRRKNPVPRDIKFPPIPSYSIPLTSLYAVQTQNLIIAEKSISVTSLVNGTSRLQPVVLGIGQAAGALASIAITQEKNPSDVNIRDVQQELLNANCYLMPYLDVKSEATYFQAVQRVGTSGLMRGEGKAVAWANETWFYPEQKAIVDDLNYALKQLNLPLIENSTSLLTREQLITALWIALDKPKSELSAASHSDIKRGSEVQRALAYFNHNELNPTWLDAKRFEPQKHVQRWELAVWLDTVFEPWSNELFASDLLN